MTKKLIIIIGSVALLLLLSFAGILFYLNKSSNQHPSANQEIKETKKEEKSSFVPVEAITLNLMGEERFLQIVLSIEITEPSLDSLLKEKMPILKDRIIRLGTQKTAKELLTIEGKEQFNQDIKNEIKKLVGTEKEKSIKELLFTNFIIQ